MDNVAGLIDDAAVLLKSGSPGRARALVILGGEEFGKAIWVYRTAHTAWSGKVDRVTLPKDFEAKARKHPPKLRTAEEFRSWLGRPFIMGEWPARNGDDGGEEHGVRTAELNDQKQAGFYVDWHDGRVRRPRDMRKTDAEQELKWLARSAGLLLLEDMFRRIEATQGDPENLDKLRDRFYRHGNLPML